MDGNGGGAVDYEPNSFGGSVEDTSVPVEPPLRIDGDAARYTTCPCDDDALYGQQRMLWERIQDGIDRMEMKQAAE